MASPTLLTRQFASLWIFGFITFFSAFQLFPVIPFHILDLGGSKAMAGWFLAIYTYASAFAAPVTGAIADHIGRRRLIMIACCSFVVFSFAYGRITAIPLLLVVACIHGALWSGILASSAAMMSEIIPESRRTEGIAYWGMSSTAALALAPLIGLFIYRRWGFFTLCLELMVLSVGMLVLAARVKEHRPETPRTRPRVRELIDFRVTSVAMSLFVVSLGYGGVTSYAALLAAERHLEPRSLYFTIFATTIIVSRLFTARWGDRHGPLRVLFPSLLMVPLSLVILGIASSQWHIVTSAVLFGLGFGGAYPAFVTFILRHTDPARRGGTFGSILWAFDTGIGTGSLLTGLVIERSGYRSAYFIAAGAGCLAIPIFLATSRRLLPGKPGGGTAVA